MNKYLDDNYNYIYGLKHDFHKRLYFHFNLQSETTRKGLVSIAWENVLSALANLPLTENNNFSA